MVISLYYMSYFLFEFQRAKCGLGNYKAKQNQCSAVKDLPYFLHLEDIIRRVKSAIENEPCKVGAKLSDISSQTSLAKQKESTKWVL